MKKIIFISLLLIISFAKAQEKVIEFTFTNNTGFDLTELYIFEDGNRKKGETKV